MRRYHDVEWGVPIRDPRDLFERLTLECMQAGLSWRTVLAKRAHMTEAFHGFEPERVAGCGDADLERWLGDAGLIRHRGKLSAMVGNAGLFLELDDSSGFLWSFVQGVPTENRWVQPESVPSHTPASHEMSRALRQRGFQFVGPTVCYAFMQSAGLVNDHLVDCFRHGELARGA